MPSCLHLLKSLNGLPNLSTLLATNCSIGPLLYNPLKLVSLVMSDNNLRDLYSIETLGYNMSIHKQFDVSSNHINYIPPENRFVPDIYYLNLSKNQLTFLPMEIFQITTLMILDISNNLFHTKELNTIVKTFQNTHPNLRLFY
jgi:Leucine-rich repeat (LRR) protein